jgi:uncharacterized protein (TIGR02598 family)
MSIRSRRNPNTPGFSLVEVVLALGVISFSLVAILGVLPAGFDADRQSIADTRAAQLASAVAATIDAQCATFTNVKCFGLTLDLEALSTTEPPKRLYASYPSPDAPKISDDPANAIYTIEMRFNNDPPVDPSGTGLGAGKLNQIELRVLSKDRARYTEYFVMARNRT